MVPNTGPYDVQVNTEAVSALFNKIGPGILVTHSQAAGQGWFIALQGSTSFMRRDVWLRKGMGGYTDGLGFDMAIAL